MTYVWDTNIIILASRDPQFLKNLDTQFGLSNRVNTIYISVVTIGEIHA
jgi:predicted nucleic acid-binding protein